MMKVLERIINTNRKLSNGKTSVIRGARTIIITFAAIVVANLTVQAAEVDLFVSCYNSNNVLRYDGESGVFIDSFASVVRAHGIVLGPDGNLYVASAFSNEVLRYDGETGVFIDSFASGGGLRAPKGLVFGTDNNLYVSSYTHEVLRYDGETGAFIDSFASGGGLSNPFGLTFGPDENLYVASAANDKVLRYDGETGVFIDSFAWGGGLDWPWDLMFHSDGKLYVSSAFTNSVLRYDAETGAFIDTFTSGGGMNLAAGLVFGPDENLYVASGWGDEVLRYDGVTGVFIDSFASGGGMDYPSFLLFIPEPSTPPVADADGPYSIYVGDTLTLDASGSSNANEDIVSYMWDLDDDGSFETDAGGQAVFTVDYAYLESLELLINYEYTIHLKVTDNEGQSDTAGSTLIILLKPALQVAVDIKPGSCPNPLRVNFIGQGVIKVAIVGSEDLDVLDVDVATITLEGVAPIKSSYKDVSTFGAEACECTTLGQDGFLDLELKFDRSSLLTALEESVGDLSLIDHRTLLPLTLEGMLYEEIADVALQGSDCVAIRNRGAIKRRK